MTHKKNDLSFELDQAQKPDPIIEIHETSFPGSRHRFIELLEDNSEGVRFDGKIDCRHLQWEFKCPKRWSELTQTALDDVRFCESCHQNVYTAYSRKDLKRLQSEGACVRIITKENGAMLGAVMAPEYDTNQGELGEALILSIVEMTQVIENYFKRRGYYDEHSLMRLQSMLSRFAQQISENLRDKNKKIHGLELTKTLGNYAEAGSEYTKILAQIIVQNRLMDFEPVKLENSIQRQELNL